MTYLKVISYGYDLTNNKPSPITKYFTSLVKNKMIASWRGKCKLEKEKFYLAAGYVLLETLNGMSLLLDDIPDHISDGNHTNNVITFNNGQMPDKFVGHELHAILDGCVKRDGDGIGCHQFPD